MRLDRDDIQDLRLLLAEKAREQEIEPNSSPRWARGEEKEPQRPRAVEGLERRDRAVSWEPARERGAADTGRQAAVSALAEERAKSRDSAGHERPCQALEYARAATLTAQIPKLENNSWRGAGHPRAYPGHRNGSGEEKGHRGQMPLHPQLKEYRQEQREKAAQERAAAEENEASQGPERER